MKKSILWNNVDKEYELMSDEALIEIIKADDKYALNFLINKYKSIVNMKVNKYFIIGAEKEDIMQEGLIGLYKAIQSYKPGKDNSFKSFVNLCVERQLITAIKTSNRQKHMPLNSYLSLSVPVFEGEDSQTSLIDVFDANVVEDPLDTITKKEYYKKVEDVIDKSLSKFEKCVLSRFIQGESYVQIAETLNAPIKSIDNAIQRIRKKAIKNMAE